MMAADPSVAMTFRGADGRRAGQGRDEMAGWRVTGGDGAVRQAHVDPYYAPLSRRCPDTPARKSRHCAYKNRQFVANYGYSVLRRRADP